MEEKAMGNGKPKPFSKQFDSTVFMIIFLIIFAGFIAALIFVDDFAKSDIASHLLLLFSGVFGAMSQYFFSTKKQENEGG